MAERNGGQHDARLDKLEEVAMFADRRADDLAEHIATLDATLKAMAERLRRMEAALSRLGGAEVEPPAGP